MNLQPLTCPHCGGVLNITTSTKVVHCEFCDSDIIIEQAHNQQQYSRPVRNPNPQFVTRNEMPMQQYQNFPPGHLFDHAAFQKWKKKFWKWIIIQAVLNFVWVMVCCLEYYYFTNYFMLPLIVALGVFFIIPPMLAVKKPIEPDAKKNRKGWNIFKYYLLFVADTAISVIIAIVFAAVFDIQYLLL